MFGVRLALDVRDRSAVALIARAAPSLVDAHWESRRGEDWTALFSPAMSEAAAVELKERGVDVVRDDPRPGLIPGVAAALHVRPARSLLEAFPPMRVGDDAPVEAVLVVEARSPLAAVTLERLLLLGKQDVLVGEVVAPSGGSLLIVRVPQPPLYLLLRARDGADEGVAAYAQTSRRTYTSWGWRHPFEDLVEKHLERTDRIALIDADGRFTRLTTLGELTPILDVVKPDVNARTETLDVHPTGLTFDVRLRMAPVDGVEPELWITDADGLLALEPLIQSMSSDDVGRLCVSRLARADGRPRYVLRELLRPDGVRVGARVSSIIGRGYARAPSFDNLYLPPDRRLTPALSRDKMKALLKLEERAAVIVDEDGDGLSIVEIPTLEDEPLTRFVTWIATDRRMELDRIIEDAVASFPRVKIERAPQQPRAPRVEDNDPAPRPRSPTVAPRPSSRIPRPADPSVPEDVHALRMQALEIEAEVLGTGGTDKRDDSHAWRSLGLLKEALDDVGDALACFEVALFLSDSPHEHAADLVRIGERGVGAKPGLVDLAVKAKKSHEENALLGGLAITTPHSAATHDALFHAAGAFLEDLGLVPRRLQWAVLHALARSTGDKLALVRAKEAVLGALNARGLSETLDLPRFVRSSMALTADGDGGVRARAHAEQMVVLERLLHVVVPKPLENTDSRNAFLSAIFAIGHARLGGRPTDIVNAVREEADTTNAPANRVLLSLYLARLSHFVTAGTVEGWIQEVDATLKTLDQAEHRRIVEWLVKRSRWLRTAPPPEPPSGLRPSLDRVLTGVTKVEQIVPAVQAVTAMAGLYDYEVVGAYDRLAARALASGKDDVMASVLSSMWKGLEKIRILAHRTRSLGTCVNLAAVLEDEASLERCIDGIINAATSPKVPSVSELLVAVRPALAALRRLGAVESAARLLHSLEPLALGTGGTAGVRDAGPLLAAIAEGLLLIGDGERAQQLIDEALTRAFAPSTGHIDRHDAVQAVLESLTHWDLEARAAVCERIARSLPLLTDTFTTQGHYPTHQLLAVERMVETVVDDATVRSDRLQAYLDHEEQRVRRRILLQFART